MPTIQSRWRIKQTKFKKSIFAKFYSQLVVLQYDSRILISTSIHRPLAAVKWRIN